MVIPPSDHRTLSPAFSVSSCHAHTSPGIASLFQLECPSWFLKERSKCFAWAEVLTHCSIVDSLLLPWQIHWNYNPFFSPHFTSYCWKHSSCWSMALFLPNPVSMPSYNILSGLWSGNGSESKQMLGFHSLSFGFSICSLPLPLFNLHTSIIS